MLINLNYASQLITISVAFQWMEETNMQAEKAAYHKLNSPKP